MPRIPEPEIERLKSEVSVERLVQASGIQLKKSGSAPAARSKAFSTNGNARR